MTFELVLDNAKLMSNMISVISSIVAESRLHIAEDGIKIKAFDATRISMVDFFLKKSAFKTFNVEAPLAIGLSLETLNTILKSVKTDESLQLSYDDDAKRFKVDFIGEKRKRSFVLSIIEMPNEDDIPDTIHIDFDANFDISASFFQQVIKDAEMISDYLKINAGSEGIEFAAASDTKEMNAFVEPESDEIATDTFDVVGDSSSVYSLDFLSNFIKGVRSSEMIRLSFSQEQPVRILHDLDDRGHLIYFVAPRIEETDDLDDEDYDDY